MKISLIVVSAVLAIGLGAANAPADPANFQSPFGFLQADTTCPEATHILRYPCPGAGQDIYLVFSKNNPPDLTPFLGRNVAIRGTQHGTACSLPLVQVTKVKLSDVLPPCPAP